MQHMPLVMAYKWIEFLTEQAGAHHEVHWRYLAWLSDMCAAPVRVSDLMGSWPASARPGSMTLSSPLTWQRPRCVYPTIELVLSSGPWAGNVLRQDLQAPGPLLNSDSIVPDATLCDS